MTDRAAASTERATACPFVAFVDERDERSDRPDHRHRCYAESRPAPRAIAHQEAFCLSPSFAGCPTFQDWARREAAHAASARSSAAAAAAVDGADLAAGDLAGAALVTADSEGPPDRVEPDDGLIDDDADYGRPSSADDPPRTTSRDWAAPPPWAVPAAAASGRAAAGTAAGAAAGASPSSDGGPSSGSDRSAAPAAAPGAGLAASRWLEDGSRSADPDGDGVSPAASHDPIVENPAGGPAPDPELAGLVGRSRPAPSRSRTASRPVPAQAKAGRRPPGDDGGPTWERPRRFEAYPTLRTRVGFPAVPRIVVALIGLALAAFILFMAPSLFFGKGDQGTGGASTTPSAAPSSSAAPTPVPAATPLTYTIKPGDNLGKIAKKFGVTQKAILAANPKIKDPNKIAIGQVIIIPTAASPTEVINSGPTSPSAAPSSAAP